MRRLTCIFAMAALMVPSLPGIARAVTIEVNPQSTVALPSDPFGAMNAARERVAAGDLKGAIAGLSIYVAGHVGEIPPERLLGDLYYRDGDLNRSVGIYEHILRYSPNDKETHSRLGSVYAVENRIDDAIAEFDRSLPGTDSVPDLVQLHLRKGDFDAYEHERERVAEAYPTVPEAQLELAQVYEATHRPDLAMIYFRRALDEDPSSLFAINGLGLAYLDERRYDEAINEYGVCLLHDAYNYPCMDNLGATYLEAQRYAAAEPVLRKARELQPERGEALVNLGYLADAQGDWKRAVAYYVQAMSVDPYSPDAYIDLGNTYDQHDLYALAQEALIKGIAVAPLDGRLHFLLGDAYQHEGKADLARDQFEDAAKNDNFDPEVKRLAQERVATLGRLPLPPKP